MSSNAPLIVQSDTRAGQLQSVSVGIAVFLCAVGLTWRRRAAGAGVHGDDRCLLSAALCWPSLCATTKARPGAGIPDVEVCVGRSCSAMGINGWGLLSWRSSDLQAFLGSALSEPDHPAVTLPSAARTPTGLDGSAHARPARSSCCCRRHLEQRQLKIGRPNSRYGGFTGCFEKSGADPCAQPSRGVKHEDFHKILGLAWPRPAVHLAALPDRAARGVSRTLALPSHHVARRRSRPPRRARGAVTSLSVGGAVLSVRAVEASPAGKGYLLERAGRRPVSVEVVGRGVAGSA